MDPVGKLLPAVIALQHRLGLTDTAVPGVGQQSCTAGLKKPGLVPAVQRWVLRVCVCVCVCVCACVRGRGGALLSLIGMFTNLSNANIKVSSWLLKGTV